MTDELTPVRCGCGGEAKVYEWFDGNSAGCMQYFVYCFDCDISTRCDYDTEAEAITAWNRAMSERTAKVEYSNADGEYLCSECGRVVQIEDAYCCGCGARLEWE